MVWFYRLRAGLLFLWPFLASLAVMAVVIACGAVVLSALDRDQKAEDLARDVRAVALDAKAASETNRQILEQIRPCVVGDPADSPACIRESERAKVIAEALGAIQHQHDEVLSRLSALLSRPAVQRTTVVREAAPAPAGGRSAPPATSGPAGAPAATQPAPEPSTTTTACDQRGKSGRCR